MISSPIAFALNCNIDMVDLEPLSDDDEVRAVHDLIGRHALLSGSALGARVVEAWPALRGQFVKVMPRDFKRVREAEAKARAEKREPAFSELVV